MGRPRKQRRCYFIDSPKRGVFLGYEIAPDGARVPTFSLDAKMIPGTSYDTREQALRVAGRIGGDVFVVEMNFTK